MHPRFCRPVASGQHRGELYHKL